MALNRTKILQAILALFLVLINSGRVNGNDVPNKYIYEIKQFEVPVDHFNFANNKTFNIRYLFNDSFIDKNNIKRSPIFFYTGNEGDIELFAKNTGFMWDLAKLFKAYVVFAEHRYYGNSLPFDNNTFNKSENYGYLSIEQTLEDFAALVIHLKQLNGPFDVPVITFGGSYGGMLAAWFRMKYPHLIEGALAASAPIWQFNSLTPCDMFARITTSVFTTSYNRNCSINIRNSWNLFKDLISTDEGKNQLNNIFKFCKPIHSQEDLNDFFDYLEDVYGNLAMANYPYANDFLSPLPEYPVRQMCLYLKDLLNGKDLLKGMQAALSVYTNFTGNTKCLKYNSAYDDNLGGKAWDIQTCNEIVMPMCSNQNTTMFRTKQWNFQEYSDKCFKKFLIRPKLNEIVSRYGAKKLDSVSNIIFSNGLLDPWSGGGVLQTSNSDVLVIIIPEGAHHLDLRANNPKDPQSVIEARSLETQTISKWIQDFFN